MEPVEAAGADARRKDVPAARRVRGLGPATRLPDQGYAQVRRAMGQLAYQDAGGPAQSVLIALIVGSEATSYTGCDQDGMCFPSIGTIAGIVGRGEKSVRESYDQLEALGLMSFPNGRSGGRNSSTVRVDAAVNPLETEGVVNPPETEGVQPPTLPISSRQPSRNRHPNQKQENQKAAAADDRGEPNAFTALVEGLELRGQGRKIVLARWQDDPERVGACVSDARIRPRIKNPAGLLVRMIQDDDRPEVRSMNVRAAALMWARNVGVHLEACGLEEELADWAGRGLDPETLDHVRTIAKGPIADAA